MAEEQQAQVWKIMETMLNHIVTNEPRLRDVEFKVRVMWWVGISIITAILLPVLTHVVQLLIKKMFGL